MSTWSGRAQVTTWASTSNWMRLPAGSPGVPGMVKVTTSRPLTVPVSMVTESRTAWGALALLRVAVTKVTPVGRVLVTTVSVAAMSPLLLT